MPKTCCSRAAERGADAPRGLLAELGAADLQHLQARQVVRRARGAASVHTSASGGTRAVMVTRSRSISGKAVVRVRAGAQHGRAARVQHAERTGRAHREVVRGGQRHEVHACPRRHRRSRCEPAQRVEVVVVRARDQLRHARASRPRAGGTPARAASARPVVATGSHADIGTARCARPGRRRRRRGAARRPRRAPSRRASRWSKPACRSAMTYAAASVKRAEVADLRLPVRGQREDRQRADPEQREDHLEELGDVRQLHDDPVALGDPARREPGGQPVGALVELAGRSSARRSAPGRRARCGRGGAAARSRSRPPKVSPRQ